MKDQSDAWLDIEGKSLARTNAETVAKRTHTYDYGAFVPGRGWAGAAGAPTRARPNTSRFGSMAPQPKSGQTRMCCDSCVK